MTRQLGLLFATAIVLAVTSGCSGPKKPNRDPVFPVHGKLTYNGKPVAGADVTFLCQEKDRSAFGRTDDEGKFQLTTFASNDGAIAGKHVIVVTKNETLETKPLPPVTSNDYSPPSSADIAKAAKVKPALPKKYADAKSSDLSAEVKSEGPNEISLELKD